MHLGHIKQLDRIQQVFDELKVLSPDTSMASNIVYKDH